MLYKETVSGHFERIVGVKSHKIDNLGKESFVTILFSTYISRSRSSVVETIQKFTKYIF